jgi:hypothetical protein
LVTKYLVAATGVILLLVAVFVVSYGAASLRVRQQTVATIPVPTDLDTLFNSPTGLYTLRYNHSWTVQRFDSQAGGLDVFSLPDATISVEAEKVSPGTTLAALIDQTLKQYRDANVQGVQRGGSVDVAGGHAELVRAVTYVNEQGLTVASAPSPAAKPRNLYQAFYLAGTTRFTFSVAWPQDDNTDYAKIFRSILHTFTLAGTS